MNELTIHIHSLVDHKGVFRPCYYSVDRGDKRLGTFANITAAKQAYQKQRQANINQ